MLARNFLPAEELGLTEGGYAAFIKLLGMLERGELVWSPLSPKHPNGFNMATCWRKWDCGTVGCIAGWTYSLLENGETSVLREGRTAAQGRAYEKLTMPTGFGSGKHTVDQAAHALQTYLTTGTPEWN